MQVHSKLIDWCIPRSEWESHDTRVHKIGFWGFVDMRENAVLDAKQNGLPLPKGHMVVMPYSELHFLKRTMRKVSKERLMSTYAIAMDKVRTDPNGRHFFNDLGLAILARSVLDDKPVVTATPADNDYIHAVNPNELSHEDPLQKGPRIRTTKVKKKKQVKVVRNPFVQDAPRRGIETTWAKTELVHKNKVVV